MAQGKSREMWNHTACLLALTAEIHRNRDERSEPFSPREFHLLEIAKGKKHSPKLMQAPIGLLKKLFIREPKNVIVAKPKKGGQQ